MRIEIFFLKKGIATSHDYFFFHHSVHKGGLCPNKTGVFAKHESPRRQQSPKLAILVY